MLLNHYKTANIFYFGVCLFKALLHHKFPLNIRKGSPIKEILGPSNLSKLSCMSSGTGRICIKMHIFFWRSFLSETVFVRPCLSL